MIGDPSPLQIFWGVQTFIAGASTVYLLVKQSHWAKLALNSSEASPGIFNFRKRVFQQHLIAVLWLLYIVWTTISAYCMDGPLNGYFDEFFTWATSPKKTNSEYAPTLIALFLYLGHLVRRLYESWGISVFSRRQLLGPIEFVRVYTFYIAAGLTIIAEAPPLSGLPCHIVTTDHKMPKGGWFDVMSSPHYFAELMIYTSIGLILGTSNVTFWWMISYVFINQFYLAYNTQKYYEDKFEDYPKDRNMFIPYLL